MTAPLILGACLPQNPPALHGTTESLLKNPGTVGFERHARAGVRGSWNSSASGVLTESEFERYRNSQRVEKYISISVG